MKRARKSECLTEADILKALALRSGMHVAEIGPARFPDAIERAVSPHGRVYTANTSLPLDLPEHCCDRVLMANVWNETTDIKAVLHEAARILCHDGRLVVIESRIPFDDVLRTLEHNSFDVHRHGDAGAQCYFIEAAVSDQSVQS